MHVPVLTNQVLEFLLPQTHRGSSFIYLDGTFGGGGHTNALYLEALKRNYQNIHFILLDQDKDAIERAHLWAQNKDIKINIFHENFVEIPRVLQQLKIKEVSIALLDIGLSSYQLQDKERGFSFNDSSMIDMRMNQEQEVTAQSILMTYSEEKLAQIFFEYGEERASRKVAQKIVTLRQKNKSFFENTQNFSSFIETIIPRRGRLHPATKIFQALRIEVNEELQKLSKTLEIPFFSDRLGVISFHSGEDRIVKRAYRKWQKEGLGEETPRRGLIPTREEIKYNPRSRSARLRVFSRKYPDEI